MSEPPPVPSPVRLRIAADPAPQITLRLLGLVARLDLVPREFRALRSRRTLLVEIMLDHLDGPATDRLHRQLAAVVGVRRVRARCSCRAVLD